MKTVKGFDVYALDEFINITPNLSGTPLASAGVVIKESGLSRPVEFPKLWVGATGPGVENPLPGAVRVARIHRNNKPVEPMSKIELQGMHVDHKTMNVDK